MGIRQLGSAGLKRLRRLYAPPLANSPNRLKRRTLMLEPLERREVLSVTVNPISGPDPNSAYDVASGKDLYVPVIGTDTGQTISYSATSSDPNVSVSVLSGNPVLSMTVSGTTAGGQAFSGTMTFQLFNNIAPTTVQGIINQVNAGLYNGASYYRMETQTGFQLIQGGIEKTAGKSDTTVLPDAFNEAAAFNSPGLLAMASAGPNTATSEFFLTGPSVPLANEPQVLNYAYTVFGQLLTGQDIYNDILNVPTTSQSGINYANTPVTIVSASMITDTQNAVLQISEPNNFTGNATITVKGTGTDSTTAQQAFTVSVAAPTAQNSGPLFLAPVANQTTAGNVSTTDTNSVSFQLSATDSQGTPTFSVTGDSSFTATPSNVTVSVSPTGLVTLTPASGFSGTITLVAHADDTANGNNLHDAEAFTLTVNPSVEVTTVTSPINSKSDTSTTISGTGDVGATVSVVATNGTASTQAQTATVLAGGTWSISGIDVSALADGTITYTATITDTSSHTAQTTKTATKDTLLPTVAVTSVTSPINNNNDTSTTISGTADLGDTISVVASDGTTTTTAQMTQILTGTSWTVNGINVSTLKDGTITYTVTASDAAGNTTQATKTTTKNTVAPSVNLTSVTSAINIDNASNTTASGTGSVGATITVVASDGTTSSAPQTTTVLADGSWSITGVNVSALKDGTITYKATATNTNGNSAASTLTATKTTVSITSVTNPITATNAAATTVSGTGQVGATISLVATDGTTTTTAQQATISAAGTWSIASVNVSTLKDGTITYTATASDSTTITATSSLTATKDTVTPTVSSITLVDANPTNAATLHFKVTFSENVTGVDATDFAIAAGGVTGASVASVSGSGTTYTVTVNAGTGTGTLGISVLNDGTIKDASGNALSGTFPDVGPTYTIAAVANASLSGFVYFDNNGNGAMDAGEAPLSGVIIELDGTDPQGNPIPSQMATTATNGSYQFAALPAGTYTVREIQPSGMTPGSSTAGTLGGISATDTISNIVAAAGASGTGYNFGQNAVIGEHISSRMFLASAPTAVQALDTAVTSGGTAPVVTSITKADADPTSTSSVDFTVNFNQSVSNVAAGDFSVVTSSGLANASVTSVSGSGSTYTVTAATGGGNGTLGIELNDDDSIVSTSGMPLGEAGVGNGSFVGPSYTISFTVAVSSVTSPINLSNDTATTASGTAAAGASISVVASDGTTTTSAQTATASSNGTWSVTGINVSGLKDGTITYTATATNSGNSATASLTANKDTVAPTVTISSVTNPINPSNEAATSINGTGTANATVSVTASDGTTTIPAQQTTVSTTGTWSISSINVSSLNDGTITYTAKLTTTDGNTAQTLQTATKGTVAIDSVTNPVNIDNVHTTTVSGTGTAGATISVTATDGTNTTAAQQTTVGSDGNWSLTPIDVSALNDGTITYTASTTDSTGHTATSTLTTTKTTVAIASVTSLVNNTNDTATTISGTGIVDTTIAVVVSDGTSQVTAQPATVGSQGTWSISGIDVSTLKDGTLTYTATATDSSNNTAVASKTTTKNTTAPTVQITGVTNPIDIANESATAVTGAGTANANISVVASDGTTTTTAQTTTISSTGTWSISTLNVSGLADGTITYTATATDSNGNKAQGSLTGNKDTVAPTVSTMTLADATPTSATTVHFEITFSEAVTNVAISDFQVVPSSGITGAAVTAVSGSGTSYSVTVTYTSGTGTLGLNLVDNDSIVDLATNPLGGTGAGNGSFTGPVYGITAPTNNQVQTAATSASSQLVDQALASEESWT